MRRFFDWLCVSGSDEQEQIAELVELKLESRVQALGQIFDQQIERLRQHRCPEYLIDWFWEQRDRVLIKAIGMHLPSGYLPFLPVITQFHLGVIGLLQLINPGYRVNIEYRGRDYVPLADIPIHQERSPYYIYAIDCSAQPGLSPQTILSQQEREDGQTGQAFTFEEGAALLLHTSGFRSCVKCPASQIKVQDQADILGVMVVSSEIRLCRGHYKHRDIDVNEDCSLDGFDLPLDLSGFVPTHA